MLTTLYEQFKLLYVEIAAQKPALAGEHALAQEVEVYTASGSNKMIYRNVSSFDWGQAVLTE